MKDIYMLIAQLVSTMSKDPNTQVGSCIISDKGEILSVGYNDVPKGWQGEFNWNRDISLGEENTKYPYVIHSEANALNNYKGAKEDLENATIYVTLFPCNQCSKQIIQAGIKRIIYKEDKYKDTKDNMLSKILLSRCGIEFIQMEDVKENSKHNKEKILK